MIPALESSKCGVRGLGGIEFGRTERMAKSAGRMLFGTEEGREGPRRKLKSVRIRVAVVRRRRAVSIAERTARVLRAGHRSRATAVMRSVAPARRRVRQDKRTTSPVQARFSGRWWFVYNILGAA